MPKAVLFQGVNKFVRHEKGPNQYGPGLIELEVMSQAVGLAKVALEQAGESLAVAGLVASHLVHGVVDGIETSGLGALGKIGLAGGGAVLGLNAHLEVLLGAVGDDLAQKLGKLCGVLSLFPGGLLPVQAYLGVTLAVGDAGHGQIHADLGALAFKIHAQASDYLIGAALRDADNVLGRPGHLTGFNLLELLGRSLALRALLGRGVALVHITTYAADPLSHDFFLL